MIERQNWLDVKAFIRYQERVEQKDPDTLRNYWVCLKHLLQWADSTIFSQVEKLENPPFPVYLLSTRNDNEYQHKKGIQLAIGMQEKICAVSRMFFKWARMEYPSRYRTVSLRWIETLRPSRRARRASARLRKVEAWNLEDVLKVAALTDDDLRMRRLDGLSLDALAGAGRYGRLDLALLRTQAAICFMYLSGMRVTAFLSLPVSCVNLDEGKIEQDPSRGVLTKFRKAAVTGLLPIPDLMNVVRRWDSIVRSSQPGGRWYAHLGRWGEVLHDDGRADAKSVRSKRTAFITSMKRVCEIAGVPYKSPHKLRHGHAVYGVKHARSIAELKAVSQNLMHSSIEITDGVYGNLTNEDARNILATLTSPQNTETHTPTHPAQVPALSELFKDPAVIAFIEVLKGANQHQS